MPGHDRQTDRPGSPPIGTACRFRRGRRGPDSHECLPRFGQAARHDRGLVTHRTGANPQLRAACHRAPGRWPCRRAGVGDGSNRPGADSRNRHERERHVHGRASTLELRRDPGGQSGDAKVGPATGSLQGRGPVMVLEHGVALQGLLHRIDDGGRGGQRAHAGGRVLCHERVRPGGAHPGLHLAVDAGHWHHGGHPAGVWRALAQGEAGRSGGPQSRSESERHAAARDHGHPTGTPPAIHWYLRQLDARLRIAARLHVLGLDGAGGRHAVHLAVPGADRCHRRPDCMDTGCGCADSGDRRPVGTAPADAGHAREHEGER